MVQLLNDFAGLNVDFRNCTTLSAWPFVHGFHQNWDAQYHCQEKLFKFICHKLRSVNFNKNLEKILDEDIMQYGDSVVVVSLMLFTLSHYGDMSHAWIVGEVE